MPGQKREARLRADVPGIHVLAIREEEDVDARDKPGHDAVGQLYFAPSFVAVAPSFATGTASGFLF
jgi:hypothetical protein